MALGLEVWKRQFCQQLGLDRFEPGVDKVVCVDRGGWTCLVLDESCTTAGSGCSREHCTGLYCTGACCVVSCCTGVC